MGVTRGHVFFENPGMAEMWISMVPMTKQGLSDKVTPDLVKISGNNESFGFNTGGASELGQGECALHGSTSKGPNVRETIEGESEAAGGQQGVRATHDGHD